MIQNIKEQYGEVLTERLLNYLYDVPVHELIEDWLYFIPKDELNKIMLSMQEHYDLENDDEIC
jgi:hypothetical protein